MGTSPPPLAAREHVCARERAWVAWYPVRHRIIRCDKVASTEVFRRHGSGGEANEGQVGLAAATSAPGLGSPLPHPRRDLAQGQEGA